MRLLRTHRQSVIGQAPAAELATHYTAKPRLYGLFLNACVLRINRLAALRCAIGMTYRSVLSGPAVPFDAGLRISAHVLVDAPLGPRHAGLLLPIAVELAEKGRSVAMAYRGQRHPRATGFRLGEQSSSRFESVTLPESSPRRFLRSLPSVAAYRKSLPWQGLFGYTMALLERNSDGLVGMWKTILQRSNVRVVLTTYPLSNWSNALLYASRQLGIQCVYLQQGLPPVYLSSMPNVTAAVVWSRLGSAILEKNGFIGRPIIIARNPSIPVPKMVDTLRTKRRKDLGLRAGDLCVLVLGGIWTDYVYTERGDLDYRRTCELLGRGLSIAARSSRVVPFLRPHYRDLAGETERALRQHELPILLLSRNAPLHEDIAAADVVLSQDSTAMEEAYLAGRPVVQIVAEECYEGDFGLLGIPVVRSPDELARCLTSRDWVTGRHQPPVLRSVAEEICELLEPRPSGGA